MNKFSFLLCLCLLTNVHAKSQQYTRYLIKFRDKGGSPFSLNTPLQYLSQRALDRRARYNISIDSMDLPVTARYIDSLRLSGTVTILNSSKWLNQVAIQTTDAAALTKINNFPFVISADSIAARLIVNPVNKQMDASNGNITGTNNSMINTTGYYNYGKSNGQVKIHNGDFLHNHGFHGEGMQMAVIDAGFYHYLSLPTFDSIRTNNQILGTWDFVANEMSVNEDYYHGMQCLSTIAANMPGTFVGTAPKTSFYLYRTEDVNSEYPIEEQNWAAAAERADSAGVDITSTSLGYFDFDNTPFDYTYNDMDGNSTISARAADIAAKKGLLVVSAAGNEGTGSWHYLITPSDADSVLSVGAVDTTRQVAGFSSYGPSSDGQVKPAVAAVGLNAIVANVNSGMPDYGSGTSFACPNMAGITTCLWQAFPEINNMGVIETLEISATKYESPDNRIGYGIPDAKKAFVILLKKLYVHQALITDCKTQLQFSVKTDNTMSVEVQRKLSADPDYSTINTLQDNGIFALHNFTFTDDLADIYLGNIQYRLKMSIAADTSFYLDTISLDYSQTCELPTENSLVISPNPVIDNLNLLFTRINNSKIDIVIHNAAGQKIYSSSFEQPAGRTLKTIAMQNLGRGIYFVTVYIDKKKEVTQKILK